MVVVPKCAAGSPVFAEAALMMMVGVWSLGQVWLGCEAWNRGWGGRRSHLGLVAVGVGG